MNSPLARALSSPLATEGMVNLGGPDQDEDHICGSAPEKRLAIHGCRRWLRCARCTSGRWQESTGRFGFSTLAWQHRVMIPLISQTGALGRSGAPARTSALQQTEAQAQAATPARTSALEQTEAQAQAATPARSSALQQTRAFARTAALTAALTVSGLAGLAGIAPPATADTARGAAPAIECLASGDGYLHAQLTGAIDATIAWPNSGTRCQGESKADPPGVRLSFQRVAAGKPDLLFVFGLTGVREGQLAHAVGTNLTLIVQGTSRIFGTLGDSRCTVDSLTQTPLKISGSYRVEARGFCTQPAHAVRGSGAVLVSTFEFAGLVNYH